jgi:hypothetical protein
MTAKWSKEYLDELKEDPKVQILHTAKGATAMNSIKQALFPYDEEAADKWAAEITSSQKRSAHLIVYSQLKRTKKVIIFKLLLGTKETGSSPGQQFTYEKGMKLIESLGIKV